jgi:hypothetical protein
MAITTPYEFTATVSTAEYSLQANSTTLASATDTGMFQLLMDLSALTATERYVLKIKEMVLSGGTQRTIQTVNLFGVQADPIYVTPPLLLTHGWDMTLTLLLGTARSIPWSIRKVG